jgi:hypothetical protein
MMNTEEVVAGSRSRKSAAALVELLAICPVCGREGLALFESRSGCCERYLLVWFIRCAA